MGARYIRTSDITDDGDDETLMRDERDDELVDVVQLESGPSPIALGFPKRGARRALCSQKRVFYGLWASVTFVLFLLVIILAYKLHHDSPAPAQTPTDAPSGGGTTTATTTTTTTTNTQSAFPCVTAECVTLAARIIADMNASAAPCADFYQYSCGGWIAGNPIPDDATRIGTFDFLEGANEEVLRAFLESGGTQASTMKAIDYYEACMNTTFLNAQANTTFWQQVVAPLLAAQGNVSQAVAFLHSLGVDVLFSMGIGPDDKNVSNNAVFVNQGGLGLPSTDYYLNKSTTSDPVLVAYQAFVSQSLQLLGWPAANASAIATSVLLFEQQLAGIFVPEAQLEDPMNEYHKLNLSDFYQLSPNFPWQQYFPLVFANGNTASFTSVITYTPAYLASLSQLLQSTSSQLLQNYFLVQALHDYALGMSQPFLDVYSNYRAVLTGASVLPPRWSICVSSADGVLGFMLGREFVEQRFSPEARAEALDMVNAIRAAFEAGLPSLSWMDNATIALATQKAQAVLPKIGYPDWIMNDTALTDYYAALAVGPNHLQNRLNANTYYFNKMVQDLGNPVDRTVWGMTPQEVNAYYNPAFNEIVFPAGILQPPFFSLNQSKSLNYGGIGSVIGHELTHGFDNQGREYDQYGNLKQWWSAASVAAFEQQAQCLATEYSKFSLNINGQTVHVDGNQTLGENIADNGGIKEAYQAYQTWVAANGPEQPLPGLALSHNQLFFMSFSQVWCNAERPASELIQLLTDPHSPGQFRVIGTVSNAEEFATAFQCPAGSPMVSETPCVLW